MDTSVMKQLVNGQNVTDTIYINLNLLNTNHGQFNQYKEVLFIHFINI